MSWNLQAPLPSISRWALTTPLAGREKGVCGGVEEGFLSGLPFIYDKYLETHPMNGPSGCKSSRSAAACNRTADKAGTRCRASGRRPREGAAAQPRRRSRSIRSDTSCSNGLGTAPPHSEPRCSQLLRWLLQSLWELSRLWQLRRNV